MLMFNTGNGGYSLADIAAATNGNDGAFGGESGAWWLIILFLFVFMGGWNRNGNGLFGGDGSTGSGITDGYILTSDFATIERKLDGVDKGICSLGYDQLTQMNSMNQNISNQGAAIQNAITQSTIADMQNTNALTAQMTGLSTQLAQCCCDNRYESATQFATLNYNIADQSCQTRRTVEDATRDIIANQDANTRSVLDFLTQDKIASLTAENQSLKFAASQQAQNAYLINAINPCPIPAYEVPSPWANVNRCCGCSCAC